MHLPSDKFIRHIENMVFKYITMKLSLKFVC